MSTTVTTKKHQFYASGVFLQLEGRLGQKLEVKETENGKEYCKVSIAINAGSKKINDEYVAQTDWYSLTIWNNNNISDLLFEAIKNNEKLVYGKGNSVSFKGRVTKTEKIYNDKAYVEFNVKELYELLKVYSGITNSDNTEKKEIEPEEYVDF